MIWELCSPNINNNFNKYSYFNIVNTIFDNFVEGDGVIASHIGNLQVL